MLRRRNVFLSCIFTLVLAPVLVAQPQDGGDGPPRPEDLKWEDGVASIPDRATYEKLSFQGDAGRDAYLNDLQFVKFQLEGAGGKDPRLYFINTKTYQAHPHFMRSIGIRGGPGGRGRGRGGPPGRGREDDSVDPEKGRQMRGAITYRPLLKAPNGEPGCYTFDFQPNDSFSVPLLKECRDRIVEKAPFLKGRFVYHPLRGGLDRYEREKAEYAKAKIPVYLDDDLDRKLGFLPLNSGVTFGRLRQMTLDAVPTARDVVLYEALPNELPRVAGVITGARQTPLSHVNLRAIQDRVPNAFVNDATKNPSIKPLIGKYVRYKVSAEGFEIREASAEEVESHFADLRPKSAQTPPRDLSVKAIRPLAEIGFADAKSFGVKTANLAELHKFKIKSATIPDGFGVPFSFYDEFMKYNGFDRLVESMLATPEFQKDRVRQQEDLSRLRRLIRGGDTPDSMFQAFEKLRASFPAGTSIRCRSSTNNEDLPNFSGAGLYESRTHDPN
ncbi:MAG: PEP/pyruvate-binding domain-containing protein, partial [Planctomycetota bacterium]